jgi:hypothetical protein
MIEPARHHGATMSDGAARVGATPDAEATVTSEGGDALIVSVGADIDVRGLEREVRAEVARKRREGVYSADLLTAVAADPVADLMFALGDAAQFSIDVPVDSSIPLWGGAVSIVKRVTARCLRWYTKWMLGQVHTFAAGAVATLNSVEARLQDHDRWLDDLTRDGGGVRNETGADPGSRFAPHVEALHAVPARVAVLPFGLGELLATLAQGGIDCYGVEPNAEPAAAFRARGLDVVQQEPHAHLAAAPPGSLGGIVMTIVDGHPNMELEDLVTLAAGALAVDGVLVLDAEPATTARAEALIKAYGFKDVRARQISPGPDGARLVPLPSVRDADLQRVVTALNANLARIDAALFGPSRTVVLARR